MKKRYLFPLIYIILFTLSFIVPKLGDVLLVFCESIVALIILSISIAMDSPKDKYYLVILGTIAQFSLIGYLWDCVSNKLGNIEYKSK